MRDIQPVPGVSATPSPSKFLIATIKMSAHPEQLRRPRYSPLVSPKGKRLKRGIPNHPLILFFSHKSIIAFRNYKIFLRHKNPFIFGYIPMGDNDYVFCGRTLYVMWREDHASQTDHGDDLHVHFHFPLLCLFCIRTRYAPYLNPWVSTVLTCNHERHRRGMCHHLV